MRNKDIVKIERLSVDESSFKIRWQVTSKCNYACDFCIQGDRAAHLNVSKGESSETRARICREIVRFIESLQGYKAVTVNLIGGEVTILKDFPELLDRLAGCRFEGKVEFRLTTNLSMPSASFLGLCDIVKSHSRHGARRSLVITASYYKAYTNPSEFCEKCIAIADAGKVDSKRFTSLLHKASRRLGRSTDSALCVGVPMLVDDDYHEMLRMRGLLGSHGVSVDPIIIREYETRLSNETREKLLSKRRKALIKVTDSQGQVSMHANIQAFGESLEDTKSFCPRGYRCDAGIRDISVNALGRVDRCPVLGGDMCLGSLLDGAFRLLEQSQVCTADHCSCSAFRLIEK